MQNPIRTLHLKNFGKHEEATFTFGPGVNLIRGANRSGKTWILRALKMLLYNEGSFNPDDSLDEVRYHDAGGRKASSFLLRLEFGDGSWLERYRDKSTNSYTFCPPNEEPSAHTAVGRGFYEPLRPITGIFPTELDGRNIYTPNVRSLGDPRFFLIGESGAQQDAVLTRVTNVDVIEEAAYQTNLDRKRVLTKIGGLQEQLDVAQEELKRYKNLPKLVANLKEAAVNLNVWRESGEKAEAAKNLFGKQSLLAVEVGRYFSLPITKVELEAVAESLGKAEVILNEVGKARDLMGRLSAAEARVASTTKLINYCAPITEELGQVLQGAHSWAQEATTAREMLLGYLGLSTTISGLEQALEAQERSVVEVIERRAGLLKEAGICPVCGQVIPEEV